MNTEPQDLPNEWERFAALASREYAGNGSRSTVRARRPVSPVAGRADEVDRRADRDSAETRKKLRDLVRRAAKIVPDVLQLRLVDVNIPQIPVDFPFCSTRTSAPPGGTLGPFTWGPFLRRHGGIQKCYVVFLRDDCGDTHADDDENWYSND
jgi:hypothetical protein